MAALTRKNVPTVRTSTLCVSQINCARTKFSQVVSVKSDTLSGDQLMKECGLPSFALLDYIVTNQLYQSTT